MKHHQNDRTGILNGINSLETGDDNGWKIPQISKRWKVEGPIITDLMEWRKLKPKSTKGRMQ